MPHPKHRKQDTRRKILAAAARLFGERGFEATSIDDVMQACGLTRGGFYLHFRSKAELHAEALRHAPTARPGLDDLFTDTLGALIERYQAFIASQFGTGWQALEAGHAYAGAGRALLLVYDHGHRFVDPGDGDRIHAWCPGSTLVKPTNVGHSRVLATAELQDAVLRFVSGSTR